MYHSYGFIRADYKLRARVCRMKVHVIHSNWVGRPFVGNAENQTQEGRSAGFFLASFSCVECLQSSFKVTTRHDCHQRKFVGKFVRLSSHRLAPVCPVHPVSLGHCRHFIYCLPSNLFTTKKQCMRLNYQTIKRGWKSCFLCTVVLTCQMRGRFAIFI